MSFIRLHKRHKNKLSPVAHSIGHKCSDGRKTIVSQVLKNGKVTLV